MVSMRTCEAELISMAALVKELRYLDYLAREVLGAPLGTCDVNIKDVNPYGPFYCDKTAAISHSQKDYPSIIEISI